VGGCRGGSVAGVRFQREAARGVTAGHESKISGAASLLSNQVPLSEHEGLVLERLRHDEATQLDELIERLEAELGSAEILRLLFDWSLQDV